MELDPNPYRATQFPPLAPRPSKAPWSVKWLFVPALWIVLSHGGGLYADNLRYLSGSPIFIPHAIGVVIGASASTVILYRAVPRWWKLLCIPFWVLFVHEILLVAVFSGLYLFG